MSSKKILSSLAEGRWLLVESEHREPLLGMITKINLMAKKLKYGKREQIVSVYLAPFKRGAKWHKGTFALSTSELLKREITFPTKEVVKDLEEECALFALATLGESQKGQGWQFSK